VNICNESFIIGHKFVTKRGKKSINESKKPPGGRQLFVNK